MTSVPARASRPSIEREDPSDEPRAHHRAGDPSLPGWAWGIILPALLGGGAWAFASVSARASEVETRSNAQISELKARIDRNDARTGALESEAARTGAKLDAIERTTQRIEAAVASLADKLDKKGPR